MYGRVREVSAHVWRGRLPRELVLVYSSTPHPRTYAVMPLRDVILIGLCVLMVDLSLLGVMEIWNVGLGDVSIISLSMAIGLSVDYVVHIR